MNSTLAASQAPNTHSPEFRVFLVDPQPIVAEGLRAVFRNQADIDLVGWADGWEQALGGLTAEAPDVLLVEVAAEGPGGDGVEVIRRAARTLPDVPLLVFSNARNQVVRALEAGARGFILKSSSSEYLVSAVRGACTGGTPISADLLPQLVARVQDGGGTPRLSARELQVLRLVATGNRTPEIAQRLSVTEPTVKTYLQRLFGKLKVSDRAEAVLAARAAGLLP
ncbi:MULTISPECIES: response regulator transcription factor [unclassified Crossiella]|uniref:response regulator transcription factor n=1 Tax=unclassified Crossiella TaxID=2620835 RepID=UPI001FFFB136|nr:MULTISPECIES: response regulator transcription factor [unclassified Crossiella]MCK2240575.1 response regulator transcription factor [Crossiella sp. S99.2]MCK2252974.1 response regulator transcription factor [Crossiella sp. S99.1]